MTTTLHALADPVLAGIGIASALAVVFAAALLGKSSREGFGDFRRSVGRLWPGRVRLSPSRRQVLAVAVLVAEGLVTVALVLGAVAAVRSPAGAVWAVPGFLGAALLLVAFTIGQAGVLGRGETVACACFGRSTTTIGPVTLLRNVLLSVTSVIGLVLAGTGPAEAREAAVLPAVLAGCVLGLLMVNMEELVDLFRPSVASTRKEG